ncbi:MAG: hypothetical protein BMS9Abin13_582 [Patescibacteria group bacterium]|nr:MAG: hypothetical protein BMS9Abin13_582 [Patescibacteria group bacterium]
MQFKVPQYIEVEDKIFGPFTFKQFIYIGGALGISYVVFQVLPFLLAIPLIVGIGFFAWALAFYPKEKFGKPFIGVVEAAFKYTMNDRLYTWKKSPPKKILEKEDERERAPLLSVPKVSGGGLKNISQNLDVGTAEEEGSEEKK